MKTSRYPIWKRILWSLGPAAYLAAVTALFYLMMRIPFGTFASWSLAFLYFSSILWVGLLAAGTWYLFRHQRKAAGWIMAVGTVLAAMYSLLAWFMSLSQRGPGY